MVIFRARTRRRWARLEFEPGLGLGVGGHGYI